MKRRDKQETDSILYVITDELNINAVPSCMHISATEDSGRARCHFVSVLQGRRPLVWKLMFTCFCTDNSVIAISSFIRLWQITKPRGVTGAFPWEDIFCLEKDRIIGLILFWNVAVDSFRLYKWVLAWMLDWSGVYRACGSQTRPHSALRAIGYCHRNTSSTMCVCVSTCQM